MKKSLSFKKFIPFLLILVFMIIAWGSGLQHHLSYESLKQYRHLLLDWVHYHAILAPFVYILIYTISTALSLPVAVFLSIFGGFLFPQPLSTLYVVIGATLGALILFLAAKTAIGELLKERAGPLMQKMQKGFEKNAANYLLFLRLVPLFPFWLVNLAPAFFGVSILTFTWTTFFGIMPGAFVFTQAGAGLGAILEKGETLSIDTIFNNQVKIALVALGIFALLPVFLKKLTKNKFNNPEK